MLSGKTLVEFYSETSDNCTESSVDPNKGIVHFIWLSKSFCDDPLPARFHKNIQSIAVGMPDRTVVKWTDSDAAVLIEDAKKAFFFYRILKTPVERADYLRMLLLHRYGGIYVDVDMLFQQSIEPHINTKRPVNLLPSPLFSEAFQSCMLVANSKKHMFWHDVACAIEESVTNARNEKAIGKPLATLLSIPFVSQLTRMAMVVLLTGPSNLDRTVANAHVNGLYTNEIGMLAAVLYSGPVGLHEEAASWTPFDKLYAGIDAMWSVLGFIYGRWRTALLLYALWLWLVRGV